MEYEVTTEGGWIVLSLCQAKWILTPGQAYEFVDRILGACDDAIEEDRGRCRGPHGDS